MIRVKHWKDAVASGEWVWPRFSPELMACKQGKCEHCGGSLEIDSQFMDRLSAMREEYGKPLIEVSGYRCPKHNSHVSSTGEKGPHTTGRAIDINIWRGNAYELNALAPAYGFTGIGVRQSGGYGGRFIHLDDLTEEDGYPRPTLWSY